MKIEIIFTLSKDDIALDVDEWSKRLGLIPLECCKYGQKIPKENSRSISSSSYWTIGVNKAECDSVNEQILEVLSVISPKANEIKSLIEEYELESGISSFIWMDEDEEVSDLDLYIDAEVIGKLSDLKADFSICLYD